jgi:serine/threonine protein kinase
MTTAPSSEGLPDRIGSYRIEDRLGSGGMGEVYRGWDERLERPVTLRRLLAKDLRDAHKSRDGDEITAGRFFERPA